MDIDVQQRFWSHVDRSAGDGCWPWTGCRDGNGYGQLNVAGRMRKAAPVCWELENAKPIPDGMWVSTTCRNPACVRPSHLVLTTRTQLSQSESRPLQRNNRSGFRGVRRKHGKWCAEVQSDGRRQHIGYFPDAESADAAARAARARLFVANDADRVSA